VQRVLFREEETKKKIMTNVQKEISRFAGKLSGPCQHFIALTAGLFVLFIPLRIYELIMVAGSHSLIPQWVILFLLGIVYDGLFVLTAAVWIAVPFLFLAIWNLKVSRIFFAILSGEILIVHLGLVNYFANANVPLGADFFGYSWKEISLTVSSSAGISIWTFVPVLLFFGLASLVFIFSRRIKISQTLILPFFCILVLVLLMRGTIIPRPNQFRQEADYNFAVNKSDFFLQKSWIYFSASGASTRTVLRPYPMYHDIQYHDVLGRFLKQTPELPNLVFIIVEGLGRDFTGEGAVYGGFTPFIDSLMQRSLYWENFLSTAGRTFNVLPSEFGSLPYGANGFMELGGLMPEHQTLISILKQHGYSTNFFYGGNANFDLQDVFLERQGIDFMLDQNQFGAGYRHADSNEKGFSWGYDDGDVFTRSLEVINSKQPSPRLDIYLTLTTHEPFSPPNKQWYGKRFDERFAVLSIPEERKKIYRDYKEVFGSLLYFDDALRQLFVEYKKRSDFEHTIFFITGDHRLIPVPLGEQIDRFHVPFMIYSPMLRETRKFSSISTHSDVTPTVLAYMHENFHIDIPEKASWLSSGIDTAQDFRNIHSLPLMRNKSELIDYIDGLYYLAGEQVYKLQSGFIADKIESDTLRTILQQKLDRFKEINTYVCENNRLLPPSSPRGPSTLSLPQDDSLFTVLKFTNLNSDQMFERAQTAAFHEKYDVARVICRRLLLTNPRNTDVRMLLGHTYAWEKNYDLARSIYEDVLHQMPENTDALGALIDLDLWKGNNERALFLSDSSLARHSNSEVLLIRKSKACANLGRTDEAKKLLRKVLAVNPQSEEAAVLKKQLGVK
jgi:lipoteichoic acid synthase